MQVLENTQKKGAQSSAQIERQLSNLQQNMQKNKLASDKGIVQRFI